MAQDLQSSVNEALSSFKDPESGKSITKTNQVQDINLDGTSVSLKLNLTTYSAPLWEETRENLAQHLRSTVNELTNVNVELGVHHRPPQPLGEIGLTVKNVIAVGSGKGGVGKSTVAVSLACGLKRAGSKVGLLDADVFGPSVPHLLGLEGGQPVRGESKFQPFDKAGISVMSMGFIVPPEQPVIFRGPMLHNTITQMLRDFEWGELDYLIIDMPPGTGDVPLSLSQVLPLTGAVVVCTPQDVALLDAVKAIGMFNTVKIPVLGVVENMSGFVCPGCSTRYDIFGSGGARKRAEDMKIPFIGEIPITIAIREHGDGGTTDENYDDPIIAPYLEKICYNLVKSLAIKAEKEPPKPQLPVLG